MAATIRRISEKASFRQWTQATDKYIGFSVSALI